MAAGLRKAGSGRPVYVGRAPGTKSSTADDGASLMTAVVTGFPRREPSGVVESGTARPIAASPRLVDRRPGVCRIESLDGDVFERRRQQPLNVAQQTRISCRHE